MGLFDKKSTKPAKMRSLRMEIDAPKKKAHSAGSGQAKPKKAPAKAMNFTQWVEHYVKMSKGNPV
jgi:hypothetical protein